MKKHVLFLLLSSVATFAQDKPKFGINTGATYSNIRGSDFTDAYDYDLNFLVGASIEVPLNEKFSLIGNVNYERKTSKTRSEPFNLPTLPDPNDPAFDPDRNFVIKKRLEYLTIPINLKYYIDAQKKFFVNGGPFLGLFLDENLKMGGKNVYSGGNGGTEKIDFGVNFGIGTNFKINDKSSLNVELRHNYGLIDIDRNIASLDESITIKTNSFNLIANWQFGS